MTKLRLALVLVLGMALGATPEAQNVTNAVVIQALQAMGLFGTGYSNTDVPSWSTSLRKYVPLAVPAGGFAPADATYITQTANASLTAEQALSTLSSGIMRVATGTGVVTSLTNSAGILANVSDATGTGALVFGTSPTFTTNVILPAGTAAAPSLVELGALTTGIALTATPSIINSIAGTARTTLTATTYTLAALLVSPASTAAAPAYAATGALTTGLAITAAPSWILGVNGTATLTGTATVTTSTVNLVVPSAGFLGFGGLTAGTVALKGSGSVLSSRLGDDSGYADFSARIYDAQTNGTAGQYRLAGALMDSVTAPTIASGGCTSPAIETNGTAGTKVTIGSSCSGVKTITLTFPASPHLWACTGNNNTSDAAQQTNYPAFRATSTTAVVLTSYDRVLGVQEDFTAADVYLFHCRPE